MVKTHENVFNSKMLSEVETFENAAKEMLCKCRSNAESVSTENANAETVLYLAWSTTRVGGFRKTKVEKKLVLFMLLLCCFNTAVTSESGD